MTSASGNRAGTVVPAIIRVRPEAPELPRLAVATWKIFPACQERQRIG